MQSDVTLVGGLIGVLIILSEVIKFLVPKMMQRNGKNGSGNSNPGHDHDLLKKIYSYTKELSKLKSAYDEDRVHTQYARDNLTKSIDALVDAVRDLSSKIEGLNRDVGRVGDDVDRVADSMEYLMRKASGENSQVGRNPTLPPG